MSAPSVNTDSFELLFDEPTLKKGLRLWEGSKIIHVSQGAGGEFIFSFKDGKNTVVDLKKRGRTIIAHSCTTCKKQLCEHFCAACFYMTSEEFHFSAQTPEKKTTRLKGPAVFNLLCAKLRALIKDHPGDISQPEKILQLFLEKNRREDMFYVYLAVLNEMAGYYHLTNRMNEKAERNILHEALEHLETVKRERLNQTQKQAWKAATANSLGSSRKFNSGTFAFLIPFGAVIISSKQELTELRSLLNKRKLRYKYPQYLDMHTIARFVLQIREAELLGQKPENALSPEWSVAKAELLLAENNVRKAFAGLKEDHLRIVGSKPGNYIQYLTYIIQKAQLYREPAYELEFTGYQMRYDPHIDPALLQRVKTLCRSEEERENFLKTVVQQLRKLPEIYFDKLVWILETEEKYDELIAEIDKHSNKFLLLNRIVIKKLPAFNDFTLKVYVKQLVDILYTARESYHQEEIFNKASVYLNALPRDVSEELVKLLLEKISRNNFAYGYFKKYAGQFNPQA